MNNLRIFFLFITAFAKASDITLSLSSDHALLFGYYTNGKDEKDIITSFFQQQEAVSLTNNQWFLIGLKNDTDSAVDTLSFSKGIPVDSSNFDIVAFKKTVLPAMDFYNKYIKAVDPLLRYYDIISFYNEFKKNASHYGSESLRKALEFAIYLQLPLEIQKILFNLYYDKSAELRILGTDDDRIKDEKLKALEGFNIFFERHKSLLIAVGDMPESFIKNQFVSSIANTDFRNQAVRSLNGLVEMIKTCFSDTVMIHLIKAHNTRTLTVDFRNNFIQEVHLENFLDQRARFSMVLNLSDNPLSPEAKKKCEQINGPLKTVDDFNQAEARKEKLIFRLRALGYLTEAMLVAASLYTLYQFYDKSFALAKPGLEQIYQKNLWQRQEFYWEPLVFCLDLLGHCLADF